MKNYIWLFFVLISLLPTLALADDAAKQNMILSPESAININTPKLKMDGGQTYYLVSGVVIEKTDAPGLPFKYNIFDFDNGLAIHIFAGNASCQNIVTPFSDLPQTRANEVKSIGCQIYNNEKRLIDHNDELDAFNRKYCAQGQ